MNTEIKYFVCLLYINGEFYGAYNGYPQQHTYIGDLPLYARLERGDTSYVQGKLLTHSEIESLLQGDVSIDQLSTEPAREFIRRIEEK